MAQPPIGVAAVTDEASAAGMTSVRLRLGLAVEAGKGGSDVADRVHVAGYPVLGADGAVHVVDALSARWGWTAQDPGKAVFAIFTGAGHETTG